MNNKIHWCIRSPRTHHNIRLGKVSVVWKLARSAGDITGRVRYANIAAILRAKVHNFWWKLEHEIIQWRSLFIDSPDFFAIHVCASIINVRLAKLSKIGQVKANLFVVHDQLAISSAQIPIKSAPLNSIERTNSDYCTSWTRTSGRWWDFK